MKAASADELRGTYQPGAGRPSRCPCSMNQTGAVPPRAGRGRCRRRAGSRRSRTTCARPARAWAARRRQRPRQQASVGTTCALARGGRPRRADSWRTASDVLRSGTRRAEKKEGGEQQEETTGETSAGSVQPTSRGGGGGGARFLDSSARRRPSGLRGSPRVLHNPGWRRRPLRTLVS